MLLSLLCCCCCKLWLFRKGKTYISIFELLWSQTHAKNCRQTNERVWQVASSNSPTSNSPPLSAVSSEAEEPAVAAGLHRNIDFHTCAAYPARSKCPSQAAACRVGPRRAGTSCCCCCCSFAEPPRTPVVRQHVPHIAAQTAVRRLLLSLATLRPCNISHYSQTSVGSTMCVRVCVCAFAGTLWLCGCGKWSCGSAGCLMLFSRDHLLNGRRSVGLHLAPQTLGRIRNYKIHATKNGNTLITSALGLSGSPRLSICLRHASTPANRLQK